MNVPGQSQSAVTPRFRHLPLTLATLVSCLAVGVLLWRNARHEALQHARTRFEFRTQEVQMAIRQRMLAYEQVLRGGTGLITLLDFPNRDKWRIYVERLEIERHFPGIQGVGFSKRIPKAERDAHIHEVRAEGFPDYTIRPGGERDEYTSIIYLEPFNWRNQRAFGFDMFSEPVRHAAMVRARDTGETALSSKVILVQETDAGVQPGFLMYLPVYRKGLAIDTVEARRRSLIGYVYSPFRARDLMRGIVGQTRPDLDLAIYDGVAISDEALLFQEHRTGTPPAQSPLFTRTVPLVINGGVWTLRFRSLPLFEATLDQRQPRQVLITAISVSLLMSAVVWSLAMARQLNVDLERRVVERTAELNREVSERERIEGEILELNQHLERRVAQRTAELEQMHRQLIDASRQAGMAEVATSVLHNVGNVLNSVNVSSTLVADRLRSSKAGGLSKLAALIAEHQHELPAFLTSDPKGKQLPSYLSKLAEHLTSEHTILIAEAELMRKNIEHIRDIVAMQQSYGRLCGVVEKVKIEDLLEDSLRMNATALSRHALQVIRHYEEVPPITVDKHQVLQILVNLIRNAQDACEQSGRADGQLTVEVQGASDRIRVVVKDNGVGIAPENLTRIFGHGFTTRKNGHGFGLHSGALAAKELGGSLSAQSAGPGQGATFALELPIKPPKKLSEAQSLMGDPSI